MKTTQILIGTLIAMTALAGCISGDDDVDAEDDGLRDRADDVEVTETTGSIKGTVSTDLFEPLGGAVVVLQEAEVETRVARNGEFVFNDVSPGRYTIMVTALGYQQAARSLAVEAGKVTPVSVVMTQMESDDPFSVLLEEVGKVTLAAAWQVEVPGVGCTNVEAVKNCGGVRLGENTEHQLVSGADVKTLMAEMVWDPAGALGETLSLDIMCSDVPRGAGGAVTEIDHPCFFDTPSRTSPIIHRVDEAHWLEHGYNFTGEWTARVFGTFGTAGTYESTGIDAGVAYEQKFTVYYTIFHKEPAPEGFSSIPDQ